MAKYKHPIAEANEMSPFDTLSPDEFYRLRTPLSNPRLRVHHQQETQPQAVHAVKCIIVCVVHGFTGESTWFVEHFLSIAAFLVPTCGDDVVCDPACADALYNRAPAKDKTLKFYPGMWHQIVGKSDDDVELVFDEFIDWLVTMADPCCLRTTLMK
ncbi:hypothetical protein MIMGU_mgv11b021545mg [Erythranthe guttata]|uniref:Serine aminopeptidase S33 domain-containing protein n=1 Tax=Erythranthe guttata TaxID=4155 RepID=A0A022RHY2_ERYGU|nr:hypothetical protein MIMGU_mgv11b021545mg [Erythranthe guttata]